MSRKYFLLLIISFLIQPQLAGGVTIVPSPPKLDASSYLVMDIDSDELIVANNVDSRVEPASLTKIMTVYVAAREIASGNINLEDEVIVSEKAWRMEGSRMFIEVNNKVTVNDLLKGIVIQSGNDASVALAEHIAGSEEVFAQVMNEYARTLGMTGTNFVNSTGWPNDNHYTTAMDMARLSKALITEFPDIYSLHSIREFTYNGITQNNRNQLLWRDDGVDGIKTGHTESAGYCLVASAKRDNMRLISVITGTSSDNDRIKSTQSLLSFSFRFFETHKIYSANEVIKTGKLWKGEQEEVQLGLDKDLYITVPRGSYKQLDAAVDLHPEITAPVIRGEVKGTLKISLEGNEITSQPLVILQDIGEGSFFSRIKDEIWLMFE